VVDHPTGVEVVIDRRKVAPVGVLLVVASIVGIEEELEAEDVERGDEVASSRAPGPRRTRTSTSEYQIASRLSSGRLGPSWAGEGAVV
jgi:hypothetical protein